MQEVLRQGWVYATKEDRAKVWGTCKVKDFLPRENIIMGDEMSDQVNTSKDVQKCLVPKPTFCKYLTSELPGFLFLSR